MATAQRLRARVPPFVSVVALVMDAPLTALSGILQRVRPDIVQFHGSEDPANRQRVWEAVAGFLRAHLDETTTGQTAGSP